MPSQHIQSLVEALPELYQPIFGHSSEYSSPSRDCEDRLRHVVRVYGALSKQKGRPLRVLDLGCAQGFFSLSLVEKGATVVGIDYQASNIELCRFLAHDNGFDESKVTFENARIESFLQERPDEMFDLVIAFSVFHHIAHERGTEAAKSLVTSVRDRASVLLAEFALAEEPLYWAKSQPADARTWLSEFPFVHLACETPTHLSDLRRPMFVASASFLVFTDTAYPFDDWKSQSHGLAGAVHQGTRRYYWSDHTLIKHMRTDSSSLGKINAEELSREVAFLSTPPQNFACPHLVESGSTSSEMWIVRERLKGELLLDKMQRGERIDSYSIVRQILKQLIALEVEGLFHADVRSWNVLVDESGRATLIDFGSITRNPVDCSWPGDPFLSFFIFVKEVASGLIGDPSPMRPPYVSPFGLPFPFSRWERSIWLLSSGDVSFSVLLAALERPSADHTTPEIPVIQAKWIRAVEQAMDEQLAHAREVDVTRTRISEAEQARFQTEAAHKASLDENARLGRVVQDLEVKLARVGADKEHLHAMLEARDAFLAEQRIRIAGFERVLSETQAGTDALRHELQRMQGVEQALSDTRSTLDELTLEHQRIQTERDFFSRRLEARSRSLLVVENLLQAQSIEARGLQVEALNFQLDANHRIHELMTSLTEKSAHLENCASELTVAHGAVADLGTINRIQLLRISDLERLVNELVRSKSWRMTQPLRSSVALVIQSKTRVSTSIRSVLRAAVASRASAHLVVFASEHPKIRRGVWQILRATGVGPAVSRVYIAQKQRAAIPTIGSSSPQSELQSSSNSPLTDEQSNWLTELRK